MKSHQILVQALEEYPYNTEFVGRNFNAGEVIQLVLRDRQGRWLPQRMVEMVMVHELAHCKQMNHSKAFWKVRDGYAGELRALWARGYTGEGLWGRGRELDTGVVQASEGEPMDVPEHLCGGTYGRRAGKRKRGGGKEKSVLSYAERKQRRILKKFGTGGMALGADDDTKVKLEKGIPKKGKPRVAGSARGRDLRAAAALARFDTAKKEDVLIKKEESSSSGSDTEDEFHQDDQNEAAVDIDGKSMFDDKGRALIKICEDEDDKDGDARREMDEIQGLTPISKKIPAKVPAASTKVETKMSTVKSTNRTLSSQISSSSSNNSSLPKPPNCRPKPPLLPQSSLPFSSTCPICSLENDPAALTCMACANVLNKVQVPDSWACNSEACKGSLYVNAGDAGVCGVCGVGKGR